MDYQQKTVKELRAIAKEHNLVRYSALRKADLIAFLINEIPRERPRSPITPTQPQWLVPAQNRKPRGVLHTDLFPETGEVTPPKPSVVNKPTPTLKPYQLRRRRNEPNRAANTFDGEKGFKTSGESYKEKKRVAKKLYRLNKKINRAKNKKVKQDLIYRRDRLKPWAYRIHKVRGTYNLKFQCWFDEYKIELSEQNTDVDIYDIFEEILTLVKKRRRLVDGDKIRLIISHESWSKPFSTELLTVNEGFEKMMAAKCGNFVEYKDVPLDEVVIEVQSFKIPRGKGRLKAVKSNIASKKCIISIKNDDTTCLARAIVTAFANINKDKWTASQIKNGFNASRKLQKDMAMKLHEEAGVPVNDFGSTIEDIIKFANHLGVQINIIDGDQFNELIFTSSNKAEKQIYLYKNRNHFDVITSMPAFLCKDYYCHSCKKPYTHRDEHKCPSKCTACFKYMSNCSKSKSIIVCKKCNRSFYGEECYDEHLRDRGIRKGVGDTVCNSVQKCLSCNRNVKNLDSHRCGYSMCKNCSEYCDIKTHLCYMKPKQCKGGKCLGEDCSEKSKCYSCKTRTEKYIFYDFEATQESGTHVVNYAHAWDFNDEEWCFDDINGFCEFVFSRDREGYTFIAHNSKGYDAQFIFRYCVNNGIKPFCIYSGTKIMYMDIMEFKIRFIDSINFVASALKVFPKTFGLKELKKGYFPHYFNKTCNQNYIGPMPSKKHYGPDQMGSEDREEFLRWHKEKVSEGYVFNFKKELRDYCRSDVDILRRSMIKFREDFINLENIDPLQYITIASVCMTIYRANYMPENTIAVHKNTADRETYSRISISWLNYIMEKENINIRHALNGGEYSFDNMRVDGFCKETNTVYEFQGCFWHGCTKCFTGDTINVKNKVDMATLNNLTLKKNNKILKAGYKLVEIYECSLSRDKDFLSWQQGRVHCDIVTPLNPRDAFFGGRTNVTKLQYAFKSGEKGRYVDFVSLYPTVQFYKKYPVGHPRKIFNPESVDRSWFGLVKCKVLPPRGLYHPVLPVKTMCGNAEKLLFPLCKACSEAKSGQACTHSDEQRCFIGTWCSNELFTAIDKGYVVKEIYEVWDFDSSEDLFKGYVRRFMQIKMESSELKVGDGCTYKTEDEFRGKIKKQLGITLGKIEKNPGKRAIAKLCLNSLWGKFGQRQNMSKTVYVTEPKEFYEILLDDSVDNLAIQFINEDMVQMTYNLKDDFVDNSKDTNIFIACFTTSHARMMLYQVLDKLGDQVLGYDTDSAWYVDRPGGATVETGDCLGDLTDELNGDHITAWCGTGPKSYAYTTSKGHSVCKVKGFTLNYENSKYINQSAMGDIVNGKKNRITIVKEQMITRDSRTRELVNKYNEKNFTLGYDKRCVQGDFDTVPYGY